MPEGQRQPAVPHKLPARLRDWVVAGEGAREVHGVTEKVGTCSKEIM